MTISYILESCESSAILKAVFKNDRSWLKTSLTNIEMHEFGI